MQRLHRAQIPISWVVADTVYGNNLDLRTWLEDHQYSFVLAVANTKQIGIMTPRGGKLVTVKEAEQLSVQPQDWQQFSVKTGTKGPLTFDWACVPILHHWEDDGQHWLLIRRIPSNPTEKTYYLVFGPAGTTLETMAWAIGRRWCIEEEFENGKDLGLDHYEVRSFVGWFRHVTLVLLALAVLTVVCAKERGSSITSSVGETNQTPWSPIPLTVPEVRRLLGRLLFPLSRNVGDVLGCRVVAQVSAGQSQRLSRQTSPQLQLVVHHAHSSQTSCCSQAVQSLIWLSQRRVCLSLSSR